MTSAAPGEIGSFAGVEITCGRVADLGDGTTVTRFVPTRNLRTIGPWCFGDDYGPLAVAKGRGMRVGPHPHIGLQTVTFLVSGEILHRDGLGSVALVRPGELALMTAGSGIAHAEESPAGAAGELQGVQLWIALPDRDRYTAPDFALHRQLPEIDLGAFTSKVLIGDFAGMASPAMGRSPLVALELSSRAAGRSAIPLTVGFDYGLWVLSGRVRVDGIALGRGSLAYVGSSASTPLGTANAERTVGGSPVRARADGEILLDASGPSRVLLIGGTPLGEDLLLWWNFVARTAEEIEAARDRWEARESPSSDGFAPVVGFDGAPIPAPPLPPGRLRPRS